MQNMYAAPEIAAHPSKDSMLPEMKEIIISAFFPFCPTNFHVLFTNFSNGERKRSECEGIWVRRKAEVTHSIIIIILRDGFGFGLSWEWNLF